MCVWYWLILKEVVQQQLKQTYLVCFPKCIFVLKQLLFLTDPKQTLLLHDLQDNIGQPIWSIGLYRCQPRLFDFWCIYIYMTYSLNNVLRSPFVNQYDDSLMSCATDDYSTVSYSLYTNLSTTSNMVGKQSPHHEVSSWAAAASMHQTWPVSFRVKKGT